MASLSVDQEVEEVVEWFSSLGLGRMAGALRNFGMDWQTLEQVVRDGHLGELQDMNGQPLQNIEQSKVKAHLERRLANHGAAAACLPGGGAPTRAPSCSAGPSATLAPASSGQGSAGEPPADGRWYSLEDGEWRLLSADLSAAAPGVTLPVSAGPVRFLAVFTSADSGHLECIECSGAELFQLRRVQADRMSSASARPSSPRCVPQRVTTEDRRVQWQAFQDGWRPCPRRCRHGGCASDSQVVRCPCEHEFCRDCGAAHQVIRAHDNRWHKPRCPAFCPYDKVSEPPRRSSECPECRQLPGEGPCAFPQDDNYPHNLIDVPEPPPVGRAPSEPRHANPKVQQLLVLGFCLERAEAAAMRHNSVEACVAWLSRETDQAIGDRLVVRCALQDIMMCAEREGFSSEEVYNVGNILGFGETCRNPKHAYCYSCAWNFVHQQVKDGLVPACPGSAFPKDHASVGGCGGEDHAPGGNCGDVGCTTCGMAILSQIQVEQIMNLYLEKNPPSHEIIEELQLKLDVLSYPSANGRPARGWVSDRLRRAYWRRALYLYGTAVECPSGHVLGLAPEGGVGRSMRCHAPDCRYNREPFCPKCGQAAHPGVQACEHVTFVAAEWVRWCNEAREAYVRQVAERSAQYRARLQEFQQRQQEHSKDLQAAQKALQDLQNDEGWKAQNCKRCPRCSRVVQHVSGCDAMLCGQNYHGGDVQQGCGHRFSWSQAPAYTASVEQRNLPTFDARPPEAEQVEVAHRIGDQPHRCDVCGEPVVGPLMVCINCPGEFAMCLDCDVKGSAFAETRCRSGDMHPRGHTFRVWTRAVE